MSDSSDLIDYARQLAAAQGIDPDFVESIGNAESGWKPGLVSKTGAMGPMQLMPATAKQLGVDPSDPYDNIRGGVTYLKQLSDQFNGDPALTAAAYNAGPGAVHKAGGVPNFPETQKYVDKVTTANIDPSNISWEPIDPSTVTVDPPGSHAASTDAIPDASEIEWQTPGSSAKPAAGAHASDYIDPSTVTLDQIPDASQIEWGTPPDGSHVGPIDAMAAGLKHATRAVFGDNVVAAINNLGARLGMGDSSNLEANATAAKNAPTSAVDNMLPQSLTTPPSAGLFNFPAMTVPIGWLPDSVKAGLVGTGKTFARVGQGIEQKYNQLTGSDNGPLAAQVAGEDAAYKPLQQAYPIATSLGESAPAMAVPLGELGVVAGMGRAAVANAIPGLLSYGTDAQRAVAGASGAIGGGVGSGVGGLLGRLANPFRPADQVAADTTAALASKYGMSLTPAEYTGSKALGGLEGTLAQLPGSSGVMAGVQQGQRVANNQAAMGLLGESLPPSGAIGNEAASIAQRNIFGRMQQAASGVTTPVDDQLVTDLGNVENKYGHRLDSNVKPALSGYINDILNQADNGMDGEFYTNLHRDLGSHAAGLQEGDPLASALRGVQAAVDSSFDRVAGPDAASAIATARGQYQNLKTLQPLIEKAELTSNNIPPSQILGRVLSQGNHQPAMRELAQLGQSMGKDYPNSGTTPRMFWQHLLTQPSTILGGAGYVGGGGLSGDQVDGAKYAALGAGAARLFPWMVAKGVTSNLGNRYLSQGLLNVSPTTEQMLMKFGGLLGSAGAHELTTQ